MPKFQILNIKENRQIRDGKLSEEKDWALTKDRDKAYFILRRFFLKVAGVKKNIMVINERWADPVNPYAVYSKEEYNDLTDLDKRSQDAFDLRAAKFRKDALFNIGRWSIILAVNSIVIIFIISVCIALARGGGA